MITGQWIGSGTRRGIDGLRRSWGSCIKTAQIIHGVHNDGVRSALLVALSASFAALCGVITSKTGVIVCCIVQAASPRSVPTHSPSSRETLRARFHGYSLTLADFLLPNIPCTTNVRISFGSRRMLSRGLWNECVHSGI